MPEFEQPPAMRPASPDPAANLDPHRWLEAYGDQLYNFALNRLHQHELAEEAVQETLLTAYRSASKFEGRSSERTWLFTILKRRICDIFENNARRQMNLPVDDEVDPERTLFDGNGNWSATHFTDLQCKVEQQEFREIVMQCLRKLPKAQSTIFLLRILQEKKTEEICQELEISATNYWARLHRARLGMAKCISERWPVDRP
jgi:RNA polymerase sigma-70 factor (TIGR02943 family)